MRDELGQFSETDGDATPSSSNPKSEKQPAELPRTADGRLDAQAFVSANPQKPGEDIFVYQGRLADMLDQTQDQSELLFAIRERYEPVADVFEGMNRWQAEQGLDVIPTGVGDVHCDLAEADAAGRAFESTPDQSSDPHVQACYDDFKRQSEEMFDFMTKPESEGGMGITVTFTNEKDPYPSAEAQSGDLRDNKHLYIESGLGGEHSASMSTEEYDRFRAVHDVFGHAAIGGGFDRHGEYQAWLVHSMMYTEPGRSAMSTEYHGVNSAMWSGDPSDPGGTGKTILLGEYATPPWERTQAAALATAMSTPPEIAELIALVGYDANFANHYRPCRWHYDEEPMAFTAAFDESQHERDERGRFTSGDGGDSDVAPLIQARERQPEKTKPGSKPAREGEILTLADLTPVERAKVMAKVEGPVPPPPPKEGEDWPGGIVPQPPEGQEWGLGVTAEEVRANYEEMFERANANPEIREAGMRWYEDTRAQADALGDRYGYGLTESATAIAAMSAGTLLGDGVSDPRNDDADGRHDARRVDRAPRSDQRRAARPQGRPGDERHEPL